MCIDVRIYTCIHVHVHVHVYMVYNGTGLQDGRLSEGDRILQINEESVIHMRCYDITAKLRSLEEAREAIRLVVAHSEREGERLKESEVVPEVMDVSDESSC